MKNLRMIINPNDRKSHINKEIYGNFSEHLGRCVYDGIWVGKDSPIPNTDGIRNDVIEAFKKIGLPVMRWPGGCFADEYHWQDGVGAPEERKGVVNNWGHVADDNSFGTHEYMRFCELVGCEPYIAGNLGSGTVRELMDWIDYMTFDGNSPMAELRRKNGRDKAWKFRYLGIGNESWGCGGNMSPETYAEHYLRYATFCRNYSGNELFKVACGPNADDYNWTEVCMKKIRPENMQGLSLHYYTVPTGDWGHKGSSTDFDDKEYYSTICGTMRIDDIITHHSEIMNRFDPQHKTGLIVDEWGCWYDVEPGTNPAFLYQLNTMRDAIVAAVNLDIFNKHSDRVIMANIAQAVNVLQSVILTEGNSMLLTPTYHVFELYKEHQNGTLVYSHCTNDPVSEHKIPAVSQSVSVNDNGAIHITISNCSLDEEYEIKCSILDTEIKSISARILTDEVHAMNTFDKPDNVVIKPYTAEQCHGGIIVKLPPCSVVAVEING